MSPTGRHLCDTSLVIDEVRSQVAVKRGFWKVEGELSRQRLDGPSEPQTSSEDQDLEINQQQPTTPRKCAHMFFYLVRRTLKVPLFLLGTATG